MLRQEWNGAQRSGPGATMNTERAHFGFGFFQRDTISLNLDMARLRPVAYGWHRLSYARMHIRDHDLREQSNMGQMAGQMARIYIHTAR